MPLRTARYALARARVSFALGLGAALISLGVTAWLVSAYLIGSRSSTLIRIELAAASAAAALASLLATHGLFAQTRSLVTLRDRLAVSEERYRSVADHSADVLTVIDPEGRITYMSPAARRVLGFDPAERVGHSFGDVNLAPDARERGRSLIAAAQRGEWDESELTGFVRLPDGSERWCEHRLRAVRDASGALRAIHVVTRDADARHRAEQRLREREQQLSFVTENTGEVLWLADATGRTLYVSSGVRRLLGYEPHERVGLAFLESGHDPAYLRRAADLLARAQRGELDEITFDGEQRRKDGSTVWVETSARVLRDADGTIHRILLVSRDISERRATERALRESEERFRNVSERSRDVITLTNADGILDFASPAAERVYGVPAARLVGTSLDFGVREPGRTQLLEAFAAAKAGKLDEARLAFEAVRPDGARVWAEIDAVVRRGPSGEFLGVQTIARDITERRRTEAVLAAQRERLRERDRELTELNAALEAFSYAVSHDLQAPLRRIRAQVDALRNPARRERDVTEGLARIAQAAEHGSRVVAGLLDLARVSHGPLALADVDLAAIARNAFARLHEAEPNRRVDLRAPEALVVSGDPTLLEILLDNLLGNAWRYSSERPDAWLELGVRSEPTRGRVYFVADNGRGFDAKLAQDLFRPFFRVESASAGFGLGLATAQRIVSRHGGEIWAESDPSGGARVSFTLAKQA